MIPNGLPPGPTRALLVAATVGLFVLVPSLATAHPIQFGALSIVHRSGLVDVRFEYSGSEEAPRGAELMPPEGCVAVGTPRRTPRGNGESIDTVLRCSDEGVEGALVLENLADGVELLVRIDNGSGPVDVFRTSGTRVEVPLRLDSEAAFIDTAGAYLLLGLEHIAEGYDHLLFVLVLLFFHRRKDENEVRGARVATWAVLGTVTAFTLGHSLTLALSTLGELTLPAAPVEACIALSIVFLAVELARAEQNDTRTGFTFRRPWAAAAVFGLLHGLGFAGALREAGLPQDGLFGALVGFNLGVELGQLLFVAFVLGLLRLLQTVPRLDIRRVPIAAAYLAGVLAMAWTLERTLALGL
ncbi:MAG: HupE/UreJ family protein [Myxococcota bacterium]